MTTIATLTMNPTIDVAYDVERVYHTHKMRAGPDRHDPGGGGINVARVFVRLGGTAHCYYLSGGATGAALDKLIERHRLVPRRIAIAGETRVSATIRESGGAEEGREYRIVPAGPQVEEAEWQRCLDLVAEDACDYLVASGSLPEGVPDDFYARLAERANAAGRRFVLDTSGRGLTGALAAGGIHLVKPSLGELSAYAGGKLDDDDEAAAAAQGLVDAGKAELVAVTLGHRGALLASRAGVTRFAPIPVEAQSAVGAGDSFLAGMVYRLAGGDTPEEAARFGVAAGAAAVMTPGTSLALAEDIHRLHRSMPAD